MKYSLRPRWWILELCMAVMIGLLLIELRMPLTPGWHKAANFIILIIVFGLVALWVHVNRAALALWEQNADENDLPLRRTYVHNEPPTAQVPAADEQLAPNDVIPSHLTQYVQERRRTQPGTPAQQSKDR